MTKALRPRGGFTTESGPFHSRQESLKTLFGPDDTPPPAGRSLYSALNQSTEDAVSTLVTLHQGSSGTDQTPNLWEELNRPRSERQRATEPPPPMAAAPPPPNNADPAAGPEGVSERDVARETLRSIDPQHLLIVAAGLFVIVAALGLSGLGGGNGGAPASTGPALAAPEALAEVEITVPTTLAPTLPPAAETSTPAPSTPAPSAPMAMGLPAELLDSAQSQVYRLYRTALGREPDREGFAFWSDRVRSGVPLERLAREFLASDEYLEQFGDDTGWDARVEHLMTNAFGPATSPALVEARRERFRGLEGEALLVAISEADETLDATGTLR